MMQQQPQAGNIECYEKLSDIGNGKFLRFNEGRLVWEGMQDKEEGRRQDHGMEGT